MSFEDVILISPHIQPIPLAEVEKLEQHLGFALPEGYREFITRFGLGEYCNLYRIYSPQQILERYQEIREHWEMYWFFEGSEHLLNPAQLQQSIILGDSFDGDEIVYYPAQPANLYMLPRHETKIYVLKADFSDLRSWQAHNPHTFLSWCDRATLNFKSFQFTLDQATCLVRFQQRWGQEQIIMLNDVVNESRWCLHFFLLPCGGWVQISQNEGLIQRPFEQKNGVVTTIVTNGLWWQMTADLENDSVATMNAFIEELVADGLLTLWRE